jgi:asparagine synthase (glutamine-hydrolysing)
MSDIEQRVWVVFNGEIYNYRELRAALEARGHRFRTQSDTETIVYGYKEWGTGVFDRLSGMFGIGIWDASQERLVLARDSMGIKLIYYCLEDGVLRFGSEIRPLATVLKHRPAVDPVALSLFLRYRYTPSPLTILSGIAKLAPGTMLICENGSVRQERWYRFQLVPFSPMPRPEAAGEELLAIYRRAVARHLVSDVPVGLLLSGGIDSGLLLGLMNENGTGWRTYTVGYAESLKDDELRDAEDTARFFGARHTAVRLSARLFDDTLPQVVRSLEEPITAPSIIPMYHVCQRARQDVKVALIGQGPDELFGGYIRHLGVQYGWVWRALPATARRMIKASFGLRSHRETVKRAFFALEEKDRLRRYQAVFSLMEAGKVESLFRPGVLPAKAGDRILEYWADLVPQMEVLDELGGLQLLELRSSLPDELLMYGDKLSMAHGLEVRVPYLDREVVEYVQRLDASFKVRYGTRKWLHRLVCRQYLPRSLRNRRKRGFSVSIVDDWFQASLDAELQETLRNPHSYLSSILATEQIARLLAEHRAGGDDHHKILSSLAIFEAWARSQGITS